MGAFVPAVITLFVHQHDVADAQFQLVLAVGWIRDDAFEPEGRGYRDQLMSFYDGWKINV